jgi:amino acid adenylation domain-containing protein
MPEQESGSSATALRDAKREMLARLLAEEGVAERTGAITRRAVDAQTPLSHAQEVLWLLDRATPGLIAYNSTLAFRLRGALNVDALRRALDALVARHEALRTRFVAVGDGVVQQVDAAAPAELAIEDLRDLSVGQQDAEAERRLREHARRPFDLGREHLFRTTLVRFSDTDATLLLLTHHIVSDAWSYGVIVRELSVLYAADVADRAPTLPEPPIQFGDFAAWERAELVGDRLRERLSYWRETLLPAAPDLAVPSDRARPTVPSFEGGRALAMLPRPVLDRLKALASSEGATLYMVLLAAFQVLLHRWSEQDDLVTGSAIAGRTRSETEDVIGYFSAALPLRTKFVAGESFRALLARVRATVLGALEHQDVPTEALVHELAEQGRAGHKPLFQAVLTMQENQGGRLELPGIDVTPFEIESGTTKFELTILPAERAEGLELLLWYRSDLFAPATADRFLGHMTSLLEAVVKDPAARVDELPLLTASERVELAAWSATSRDLGAPATITALIQGAAARGASSAAIVSGDETLSWGELSARANQLAHRLQTLGVGPDVPVGLCIERSADLVVGMLGILAAGGAYVPLLPDQPAARLAQQLSESGASIVVTESAHRAKLPAGMAVVLLDAEADSLAALPTSVPENGATPESLAYVLFTSGSTGVPKGVAVTHANLVHYTRSIATVLGIDLTGASQPWHCATVSTLAADLGHTSVFSALASGGTLHVLPEELLMNAASFQGYVARHPLDLLKITPSHLHALIGPEFRAEHLPKKWLVLGGEACPWSLVERVMAAGACRVLNHYGPTEATVGACAFEVGARDVSASAPATVPIGRPLPNVSAHVLDRERQLVGVGIPGELWIGGAGIAQGYLHRDDLTRERFVVRDGERLYRTGDRVRRLATGDLEFLGRIDQQVKVRGHRVELGEIETALVRHPAVRQAVVTLREERLVGYVVLATTASDETLTDHVASELPDYMVPAVWVRIDAVPLNANGKVDRAALPAPVAAVESTSDDTPQTETERALVALWAEVLKKDTIGVHENFFALGGHSLLAIRLLGKIAKGFGKRLTLRTLFENPTIATLAPLVEPQDAGVSV